MSESGQGLCWAHFRSVLSYVVACCALADSPAKWCECFWRSSSCLGSIKSTNVAPGKYIAMRRKPCRTKRDAAWRCEFMNLSPIASNCPDQLCWCMPSQSKQSQECWHTNLHAYGCAWSPYWFEGRSMFLGAIAVILRIRIRNLSHFIDIRNYVPLLSAW